MERDVSAKGDGWESVWISQFRHLGTPAWLQIYNDWIREAEINLRAGLKKGSVSERRRGRQLSLTSQRDGKPEMLQRTAYVC